MEAKNIAEYKAVREEIGTIKNCITTYVGFVVAGSATSFWGLASHAFHDEPEQLAWSIVAILLAITATFVLFLLSYKFTSHNRLVGYSKLLAHERFHAKEGGKPNTDDRDFACWEICLDQLRAADSREDGLCNLCEGVAIETLGKKGFDLNALKAKIRKISGSKPEKDRRCRWYRCGFMLWSSADKSGSWKFPLYVARIFAAINVIFIAFAVLFLMTSPRSRFFRWPGVLVLILFVVLLVLWAKFLSKLARQWRGSETVDDFCWKFLPIRFHLISEFDPKIKYDLVGVSIEEQGKARNGQPAQAAGAAGFGGY